MCKTPVFSIIIPVYNVEDYIHKCVNSVLIQDFQDFEIILVDDGSPDNCPQICDDFSRSDSRIKVIHQANGGLSDARNAGIKNSSGEYLMFLDSDDYWDGNVHLRNIADILINDKTIDTVLFRSKHLFDNEDNLDDRNSEAPSTNSINDSDLKLIRMIELGSQSSSACLRVVKRDLIVDNNIFFVKDLIGEDSDWFIHLCLFAKKHYEYPVTFYVYRQNREGSITSVIKKKTFEDQLYLIDKWSKYIDSNDYNENLKIALRGFIAYLYSILILHLSKLPENEYRFFYNELNKRTFLLNFSLNKKSIFIKYMQKLIGLKYTVTIVNKMYFYIDKHRKK